jgi:hypothetical protein
VHHENPLQVSPSMEEEAKLKNNITLTLTALTSNEYGFVNGLGCQADCEVGVLPLVRPKKKVAGML